MKVEARKMFRSNGLIDDIVIIGNPQDFENFSQEIRRASNSSERLILMTASEIRLEVSIDDMADDLFVSLQNTDNEYYSIESWLSRDILRVKGNKFILSELSEFVSDVSKRGEGYSYLSEYSTLSGYDNGSPRCRLQVEFT